MRAERDSALDLVDKMREQVEDAGNMIDRWIEVFDIIQDDKGVWQFRQRELWEKHATLRDDHNKLITRWNKFAARYNAAVDPQPIDRPLASSAAQVADVHRRRKTGESLRKIAMATGLSFSTVRTIVEKKGGTDRTTRSRDKMRRMEFDWLRAAEYRRRKRIQDALPKQIGDVTARGVDLVKAAKGLGKD